ncbi:MAG: hypothetical protein AB1918_05065 [Pseudomonadota bacterium]
MDLARAVFAMVVLASLLAGAARAGELVMFESGRCPWCVKWHRELGPIYPRTEEGKLLPLRRVDLLGSVPADLARVRGIKYSPTFVVMHCGRERGRVVGYGSEEQFWGEISIIVDRLKKEGWPDAPC